MSYYASIVEPLNGVCRAVVRRDSQVIHTVVGNSDAAVIGQARSLCGALERASRNTLAALDEIEALCQAGYPEQAALIARRARELEEARQ